MPMPTQFCRAPVVEHEHQVNSRLVGILGGMGPAATVDFYEKVVRHTPATRDQDHLRVVIWADPTVPSRQEAILGEGPDPTPWLRQGVGHLVAAGSEIIVVPCNTVHNYMPAVMRDQPVEFISIIDATVEALVNRHVQQVGLLATDAALAARLFQTAFDAVGIGVILPSPQQQSEVMTLVEAVKSGQLAPILREQLGHIMADLRARGAGVTVAGCTEISTLLGSMALAQDAEVIDPALELALKTIERAKVRSL